MVGPFSTRHQVSTALGRPLTVYAGKYSQVVLGSGNTFTSNKASNQGGALYWDYNEPKNVSSQTYSVNTATKYGNNYGCFAQIMKTMTEAEYNASNSLR